MKKTKQHSDEKILNQIYLIRGQKVMIDTDLAMIYGIETKRLKEAVRRNLVRFPEDFMFQMTAEELENQRTQIASFNLLKYNPFCFTEQGVTMLACILNSDLAIQMNIRIIRLFTRMREALFVHRELMKRLETLEKDNAVHDDQIRHIFDALKLLIQRDEIRVKTRTIGFNKNREE